jgi:hypothetical protein
VSVADFLPIVLSTTVTPLDQNGQYTISGTNLMFTANGSSPVTYAFCVQGNTLTDAYTGGESPVLSIYTRH